MKKNVKLFAAIAAAAAAAAGGFAVAKYLKRDNDDIFEDEDDFDFSDNDSNGGFKSRADVLETAAQIAATFAEYSAYIDSQNKKNAFVDTGETYEKLLNVVTYSLRSLEETAFNLPVTRIITLDRDRQLLVHAIVDHL